MRFQCVNCKNVLSVDNDMAGTAAVCGECGCTLAVPTHRYAPGVLIGDFRIINKIGEGAVGTVYYSHQVSLDRPAALKILRSSLAEDADYRERFLLEARTAAKLNHPGIVQAYAVGEQEGEYYFAMEYVEGSTLKKVLAHSGSIMVRRALTIIHHVAEAIDFAWTSAKLVHRDIKPDNIILTEDGQTKLADLGLARVGGNILEDDAENVFGTPQYIAPEQLMGEAVDCRADIYSLGATLYQLVTGKYPYNGADAGTVSRKHLYEPLTPPSEISKDIPENVSVLIQIMMAKRATNRYQTPRELLEDLDNIANGQPMKRQLPTDSQELFPPEDSEDSEAPFDANKAAAVPTGGEQANAAPAKPGGKRRLKVSRRRAGPSADGQTAVAGGTSPRPAGTKAKIRTTKKETAKPASGASASSAEAVGATGNEPPAETTPQTGRPKGGGTAQEKNGGGASAKIAWALVILLLLGGAGGGGAFWYFQVYQAVPGNGDDSANGAGNGGADTAVESARKLLENGKTQQALRVAQAFLTKDDTDPVEATRMRAVVSGAVEEEVRRQRGLRTEQQREEWRERAEDLAREAARKEQIRQQELDEQRKREERERRKAAEEELRQDRLQRLRKQREQARRSIVEQCRERKYALARMELIALKNADEDGFVRSALSFQDIKALARQDGKDFVEWATQMEKAIEAARKAFEAVSGSGELLEGFALVPQNWSDSENVVRMRVNFVTSKNVAVTSRRKVYNDGVFDRMEQESRRIPFTETTPAAMGRLFDEVWRRQDRGGLIERDMQFAALLVCEARGLELAAKRLEGATGALKTFLEEEIKALRELDI